MRQFSGRVCRRLAELLLEIVEGPGAGTQLPLSEGVELGRDPGLATTLDDAQVSRRHARIVPAGDGAVVSDLGSTNGTYVNDQPIQGERRIAPGDRVRVGLTVLALRTRQEANMQGSALSKVPPLTRVGANVLAPAASRELAPVHAGQADNLGLLTEESEPAFIQASAVNVGLGRSAPRAGAGGGTHSPEDIARLVDTRVKAQTGVAAFAMLGVAALAVAIFFGVR